jgi:hypothetical protein
MRGKRKGGGRARDDVVEEDSAIPTGPWCLRKSGKSDVELVAELDLGYVSEEEEFADEKEWEVDKDLTGKTFSSSKIGGQALPLSSSYRDVARRGSHAAQRRRGGGSAQTGAAAAPPLPIGTPGGRWLSSIFEAGSYQSTRVDNDRVRAMDLASVDALVEVSELILLRVSF